MKAKINYRVRHSFSHLMMPKQWAGCLEFILRENTLQKLSKYIKFNYCALSSFHIARYRLFNRLYTVTGNISIEYCRS